MQSNFTVSLTCCLNSAKSTDLHINVKQVYSVVKIYWVQWSLFLGKRIHVQAKSHWKSYISHVSYKVSLCVFVCVWKHSLSCWFQICVPYNTVDGIVMMKAKLLLQLCQHPTKHFSVQLLLQMAQCQELMDLSQMSSTNGFNDKGSYDYHLTHSHWTCLTLLPWCKINSAKPHFTDGRRWVRNIDLATLVLQKGQAKHDVNCLKEIDVYF